MAYRTMQFPVTRHHSSTASQYWWYILDVMASRCAREGDMNWAFRAQQLVQIIRKRGVAIHPNNVYVLLNRMARCGLVRSERFGGGYRYWFLTDHGLTVRTQHSERVEDVPPLSSIPDTTAIIA